MSGAPSKAAAPEPAVERPTALVVDDDGAFRESLELLVAREGFTTRGAATLRDAAAALQKESPDVVLVDLSLPDGDGLAWAREAAVAAGAEVIVITGQSSVESAVDALKGGVLDYLVKPIDRGRLRTALVNVSRTRALKREVGSLREELRDLGRYGPLVGRSRAMLEVYDWIARVAPTDATVLVTGESGTGKELVAETIHRASRRREARLVPLNCGAISPNLIESELFGHERGSFTGAERQRKGIFEQAHGGTLFLDEVTEMPLELQVKLLRVLETGTVVRVGGTEAIAVDVRVVAATNRDPAEAVRSGRLREDLFYRLNVFPIVLPPLRSRPDDIEFLAQHFLAELDRGTERPRRWSGAALARLRALPWTGNVRELRNVVQRATILGGEEIGPEVLPPLPGSPPERTDSPVVSVRVGASVAEAERQLVLATLAFTGGDKPRTAEILGMSLKTLYNRLSVYRASDEGAAAGRDPARLPLD